jgi:mycothiol S-conjugate amidase
VLTYDENGGYPHPDHVMTHKISVVAFDAAGDPDRYPEAGEPWQPLKLYYHMSFGRARFVQMHEALLAAGLESPYEEWLKEWDGEDTVTPRITTRVECAEWFPRRDEALLAHATQIDPTSRWFAVPLQLRQEIAPTEDYELARSLVDTDLPEDDLFAGVRETISA